MRRFSIAILLLLAACGGTDKSPGLGTTQRWEGRAFAVIGDFGTGEETEFAVAQRMCDWQEQNPFDLVITTGDNVYPGGEQERFDDVLYEPLACLIESGVEFRASLGNHDVYTNQGHHVLNESLLGMEGRRYVVRQQGVRFVFADSNDIDFEWIEREIQEEKGDRWTIVVFHHPVYSAETKRGSDPEFISRLVPMFTEHGVDLVLNGHDHLYSATEEVGGVRYVVTGGGGASLYPCGELDVLDVCRSEHHFVYVEVRPSHLEVTAVPLEGDPFHDFRIEADD